MAVRSVALIFIFVCCFLSRAGLPLTWRDYGTAVVSSTIIWNYFQKRPLPERHIDNIVWSHPVEQRLSTVQKMLNDGQITQREFAQYRSIISDQLAYPAIEAERRRNAQTPAQAAGIEDHRWTIQEVVEETEKHVRAKEESAFLTAFESAGL